VIHQVWESEGKWFPKYLNDDHFKHLGKDLLAEGQAKKKVLAKLNEYVGLVDGTLLNDIPKLWIWANYVVHKISWLFLIHDFPPSFVESTLQPIERRTLKKWGGLPKSGDPSIFFRSKEHFGTMTSVNIRPNETSVALSSVVPMNGRSVWRWTNSLLKSRRTRSRAVLKQTALALDMVPQSTNAASHRAQKVNASRCCECSQR